MEERVFEVQALFQESSITPRSLCQMQRVTIIQVHEMKK